MSAAVIFNATSALLTGTIKNNAGAGFQPTTLTITIRNRGTGAIVNSKSDTALTPIGTYVTAGGVVSIPLTPADNTLVGTGDKEIHRIVLKWTYNAGADAGAAFIDYTVQKPDTV